MTENLDEQAICLAGWLDQLAVTAHSMPETERLLLTTKLRSLETSVAKALRKLREHVQPESEGKR